MYERLLDHIRLPAEITRFEREYLERTNRVALTFFVLHLPLFVLVAWANDTGPGLALILTALGLSGPLLAIRALQNPRHVSIVFGIAAMFLGALLVHFGRGLWTIEMHFYFFVGIALCAVFANPEVIIAAALTVTVHHAVLWLLLPESVFNYDAPLSSVAVHAAFVVVESMAACFVARRFFDNVIGLERIVTERTRSLDAKNHDMQLVFDHVEQGFLTASLDGTLSTEHSRAIGRWIGAPVPGQRIWDYFAAADPTFATWLELGWEALVEAILPFDLLLAQLPGRFTIGERTYEVQYQPIEIDGTPQKLLVIVTDGSERLARERSDTIQRETIAVFQRITSDRSGFLEFFEETTARVRDLVDPAATDPLEMARGIHTIKGNAALFGVTSVVAACDAAESRCADTGEPPGLEDREVVASAWRAASTRILTFLGERDDGVVEVEEGEFVDLLRAIADGCPRDEIADRIADWRNEPTRRRLVRFGDQAQALACRLGIPPIEVVVTDNQVRLPRESLAPFWAALVHVVRNAVDHGLVSRSGGPRRLDLSTRRADGRVVVSIHDNGPGIDWDGLRRKTVLQGLPADSRDDLLRAMFRDGVTTRATATEVSGRGIGLAAVRQVCTALGAEIVVLSDPMAGTRFDFLLPAELSAVRAA